MSIRKRHFGPHPECLRNILVFSSEHMAKELGDVAWYLAISADAIGYDLETIFQMNIDKLRARYPDGFNAEHSLHRRANDI